MTRINTLVYNIKNLINPLIYKFYIPNFIKKIYKKKSKTRKDYKMATSILFIRILGDNS